ncbi:hypothetical protein ACFVH6_22185 [Spirillospora sp. NPDC127200]
MTTPSPAADERTARAADKAAPGVTPGAAAHPGPCPPPHSAPWSGQGPATQLAIPIQLSLTDLAEQEAAT